MNRKSKVFVISLLFLVVLFFPSCDDIGKEIAINSPVGEIPDYSGSNPLPMLEDNVVDDNIPVTNGIYFGKIVPVAVIGENLPFYIFEPDGSIDSNILFCRFVFQDLIVKGEFPEIPIERIPTLTAKVTAQESGDTEYYTLARDESFNAMVMVNFGDRTDIPPPHGPFAVILLRSSILPVTYELNEAVINDGLLTVSPKGDCLLAEIIFQDKAYTVTIDIKPTKEYTASIVVQPK